MSTKSPFELPDDDILYEIFHTVAALDPPKASRFRPNHVCIHLGWLTLTHVCRRWRAILVHDTPRLWADLPCVIPSALDDILERARDLPLAVRTRVKFNSERDEFKTCLSFSKRIREIAVALAHRAYVFEYEHFSRNPDMGWYHALDRTPLPLLRELKVLESRVDATRPEEYARRSLHLDAPNLRSASISIRGSVVFLHPSLVTLNVDAGCVELLRDPLSGLLRILASQPLLQSFTTSFQSLNSDIGWGGNIAFPLPVRLDQLKEISISSWKIADLVSFFRSVDCPSIHRMRLSIRQSQTEDWQSCIRLFEPIALLNGVNTLSLRRPASGYYTYTLHHSPDSWNECTKPAEEGPQAVFQAHFNDFHTPSFADVHLALSNLRRPGAIRRVVFDETISRTDYTKLRRAFCAHAQDFASVASLWISRHDGYCLLAPLAWEDDSATHILRHISELAVPHIYPPIATQSKSDLELQSVAGETRWRELVGVLEKRVEIGRPIRRLVLLGTWMSEEERAACHEMDSYGMARIREAGVHEVVDRRSVWHE